MDKDGYATYRRNLDGEYHELFFTLDMSCLAADVVIGRPHCQLFSVGGVGQRV